MDFIIVISIFISSLEFVIAIQFIKINYNTYMKFQYFVSDEQTHIPTLKIGKFKRCIKKALQISPK